jgi:hypothetical protein
VTHNFAQGAFTPASRDFAKDHFHTRIPKRANQTAHARGSTANTKQF